jgi:hypothetical protein
MQYNILVGKPEGKRSFRRLGCRWEDDIRTNFREKGGKGWSGCICLRIRTSGGLL